jgi:hypothetical protein
MPKGAVSAGDRLSDAQGPNVVQPGCLLKIGSLRALF